MPSADASALDAVTVDAFGTLLVLEDPVEPLRHALAERQIERSRGQVSGAFQVEAAHYRPRSLRGRDSSSLAVLRTECVAVFLAQLEVDLDPSEFVPAFMASVVFRPADGAVAALDRLHEAGLELACVANWDVGLHEHLERLGLDERFSVVMTSAEAGSEKPEPSIFLQALARIGVEPGRALHVGDENVDRDGAVAAGLAFERAPLATLAGRIGL